MTIGFRPSNSSSYLQENRFAFYLLVLILLSACGSAVEKQVVDNNYLCSSQEGLDPVCGFGSAPEDMEWLPDGSIMLSEYGMLGTWEGRIVLLQPDTKTIIPLYGKEYGRGQGNAITSTNAEALWGEQLCVEQDYFSPHGISLGQRPDGRWQLLVVNHSKQETIEFFELLKTQDSWELAWRGCVTADDDSYFNDVTVAGDGFYTTRFFAKGTDPGLDLAENRNNGFVKKWTHEQGWLDLPETAAIGSNGLLWNPGANELVVAGWGSSHVSVYDGDGRLKHRIDLPWPDNISWSEDRQSYLVATKKGSFDMVVECGAKQPDLCPAKFTIYELFPSSTKIKKRFYHDGSFFGMASTATEREGKLYIGSWIGNRLLVADAPNH